MSTSTNLQIGEQQRRQYHDDGYFILERVIADEHVAMLRSEAQRFVELENAAMDAAGTDVRGLNHRNRRYFIEHPSRRSPQVREFLFSEVMAEICRATLGDQAYLFWEQFVVKAAEQGMKFGWHQDSGFVSNVKHKPYVSCWCALTDATVANGTIYVLPFSRAGTREVVEHVTEQGTNDRIGYQGDDPGDPVIVPAGSIAVFSSVTLHRSGPNTTGEMRPVYLAQFSSEVIPNAAGTGPWGRDEPFLQNGQRVGAF